jgi:hypothetical protein
MLTAMPRNLLEPMKPDLPRQPPWEHIDEKGPLTAFFATVWQVLSRPDAFFRDLDPDGPVGRVFGFWLLTALPPLVVSGLSANRLIERMLSGEFTGGTALDWHLPGWVLPAAAPLVQFGGLLLGVAVIHIVLRGLGQARGGWTGTWRAAGYASAPALVGLVPVVGSMVAGLWAAVVQYMALRRVHGAPTWAVVTAYLVPFLFVMLLAILAYSLFVRARLSALGI